MSKVTEEPVKILDIGISKNSHDIQNLNLYQRIEGCMEWTEGFNRLK